MQVVLALLVVIGVIAVWTRVCRAVAARQRSRPPREQARRPLPGRLPAGHRPPPGLGPLSPSERFLTAEAARGLRELQLFLAEERTV